MSGGHFDYQQFHLRDIADSIDRAINANCKGETLYSAETINRFHQASATLKRAEAMVQRIDWLLSSDDDEQSFHRRWDEELGVCST